ncbi:MAG TPA: glycosyltransferase family 9 protein [Mycobacteriales bacterium]|nr:glycosyltransferase family 9 protein [Mycobacteriales bacterium]
MTPATGPASGPVGTTGVGGVLTAEHPRSVVVLRALPGLGDLLCAVPALRALRHALPGAHLALLGLPAARAVLAHVGPYVDEVLDAAGWPGLPESPLRDPGETLAGLGAAQRRRFDLALQLHGSGLVTNPLVSLLGAARTAGSYLPGQWCPDPETFVPYPADQPEVRRLLAVVTHLGAPARGEHLEWRVSEADRGEARALLRDALGAPDAAYAVVHPGASTATRRWPAERFAAVADALAAAGLRVVLTGTEAERPTTARVRSAARTAPRDLAGATSLGALAALVAGARLVVSNDTGAAHLATALRAPSVVVFTGSDPWRWTPSDRGRHHVVVDPPEPPRPWLRPDGARRCLGEGCVAPDAGLRLRPPPVGAVLAAVEEALAVAPS